jgi:CDGSH-type Zn-finger protein
MARVVRLVQTGPMKIEPGQTKPVWICACGLSKTFPICDGSHKTTAKQEEPGKLYHYDPATLAVRRVEDDPMGHEAGPTGG